nr:MAG TPA: hypothetical protein [Caudoviricetes sp.]
MQKRNFILSCVTNRKSGLFCPTPLPQTISKKLLLI